MLFEKADRLVRLQLDQKGVVSVKESHSESFCQWEQKKCDWIRKGRNAHTLSRSTSQIVHGSWEQFNGRRRFSRNGQISSQYFLSNNQYFLSVLLS